MTSAVVIETVVRDDCSARAATVAPYSSGASVSVTSATISSSPRCATTVTTSPGRLSLDHDIQSLPRSEPRASDDLPYTLVSIGGDESRA